MSFLYCLVGSVEEIYIAFMGGDWGFGSLAKFIDSDDAIYIVNRAFELGAWWRQLLDLIPVFS